MTLRIAALVWICLCLSSLHAFADDATPVSTSEATPPPSGFTFSCIHPDLTITFVSPTNQDADDNMIATVTSRGVTKSLPIPPGGYSPFEDFTTGQKGVCAIDGRKIQAYAAGKDQIILFVASDHHPSIPDIVAFLIDTQNMVVLDAKNLGVSKDDEPGIIITPQGFKARMVKETHVEGLTCDCSASYVDAWMKIWVQNNQIATQWMRD